MRKCKITVFDYADARHGSAACHYNFLHPPKVKTYEVEAWCVGGDTGVRAYWVQEERLFVAHGDDGHWWLDSVIGANWVSEMLEAMEEAVKE